MILSLVRLRASFSLHSPELARRGQKSFLPDRADTDTRRFIMSSLADRETVRLVAPSSTDERKGKVIMIHGWAQNAFVMKSKSKGLTRYVHIVSPLSRPEINVKDSSFPPEN